jgi:hypothetical protein
MAFGEVEIKAVNDFFTHLVIFYFTNQNKSAHFK